MSSGVFAVTRMKNTKFITVPQFRQNWQTWRNKESTELYCLFIAADSIFVAINFIECIVLSSEKNELSFLIRQGPSAAEFQIR